VTRYIFIGAGAIGSALAGLLARQDHDVVAVARGDHAQAMIENGLRLRCPDTDFTVPLPTVTGPDSVKLTVDDVLVLTTKTQQAQAAIGQWADVPVYGREGEVAGRAASLLPIFTALNGVASEEIALRVFDRVFAVSVWFPAVMIDPGEVIVRGEPPRGIFHVGRYGVSPDPSGDAALLERVRGDWDDAGCRIVPAGDIMEWKYRKLLTNLANVLQALLGDTTGAGDIARAADAEAREILAAAGISYTGDAETQAAWRDYVPKPVPGEPELLGGSSWQSLIRGTGSIETDYLNGEIALIARRIGRAAPVNAGLTALARKAAREGLRPGSVSVAELRAQLGLS
jgi:2-dehydropantoate 2-reductase